MFNFTDGAQGKGSGYIILNIVRALNIVTLAAVGAACWVMIVVAGMPNGFAFFNAVSLVFVSGVAVFLTISELGLFKNWFNKHWPVLGEGRGFICFGFGLFIMGCHTLGELSHPPNTVETLGLPMWRLVIAAGILALVFGLINIICSLLFSNGSVRARDFRSGGATVSEVDYKDDYASTGSYRSGSVREEKRKTFFPWGGKEKNEQMPKPRFNISAPISGPISGPSDPERGWSDYPHDEGKRSPIMPEVRRPASALHPAITAGRSSTYSVASHLTRI